MSTRATALTFKVRANWPTIICAAAGFFIYQGSAISTNTLLCCYFFRKCWQPPEVGGWRWDRHHRITLHTSQGEGEMWRAEIEGNRNDYHRYSIRKSQYKNAKLAFFSLDALMGIFRLWGKIEFYPSKKLNFSTRVQLMQKWLKFSLTHLGEQFFFQIYFGCSHFVNF